jgi:dipeptidyl aminopeptidase/acylaminoacyl peptidase
VSNWNGPQGAIQRERIAGITFAPDGRSVLLSRSHGKSSCLYKVALGTGESVRLTRAASGIESSPAYSPDGRLVVFLYGAPQQERPRIFVIDTNDDSAHALFSSRVNANDRTSANRLAFPAVFNPLIFERREETAVFHGRREREPTVYLLAR